MDGNIWVLWYAECSVAGAASPDTAPLGSTPKPPSTHTQLTFNPKMLKLMKVPKNAVVPPPGPIHHTQLTLDFKKSPNM